MMLENNISIKIFRKEITHFPIVIPLETEQAERIFLRSATMFSFGFDLRVSEPQLISILAWDIFSSLFISFILMYHVSQLPSLFFSFFLVL